MPVYQVEDAQGRVLELEGDHEPTPDELTRIFAEAFPAKQDTSPSLRTAIPEPGQQTAILSGPAQSAPVAQAFPAQEQAMAETAKLPGLGVAEAERMLTTPQVSLPRFGKEGTVTRGLSELGAGLVEQAALTPASPVLGLATTLPGVRIAAGTLLTAAAAKGAAEKLGEASVTGNPQTITEGIGLGALAGLGAVGVGADAIARVAAPASAQAAKTTGEALGVTKATEPVLPSASAKAQPNEAATPLGLDRDAKADPSLRLLAEDEFLTQRKVAKKELWDMEGVFDERELSRQETQRLAELQDRFTAYEIEHYRRKWQNIVTEEVFHEMLNLSDNLNPKSSRLTKQEDFQKFRELTEILESRAGDQMVSDWFTEFLGRSADAREVYKERYERVKQLVKITKDQPKAILSTASPASAGTGTLGIVPESTQKLMELQRGRELIDQERIKTAEKPQDVLAGRDWWASPEFEFRNDPVAGPMATDLLEANLAFKSRRDHTVQQLEAVQKTLSESEQRELTKAMFAKEAGTDADAITKLSPQAQEAWKTIRKTYDDIRERVITEKQESVMRELDGPQRNALDMMRDGATLDEAARANGLTAGGKSIVESAFSEVSELKDWGIEDYTTHIERGSYRIVTEDGNTVAVAETRPQAAIKADKYLKENPGVKSLTIDDSFNPGTEFPTKLSKGQYFRLVQRLKDNLGESATEIQRMLHENGSIVAVKPTSKYASPMLERHNVLKGEQNVFDVLPYYVHVMEKKLGLDPVLKTVRDNLSKLAPETQKQIEALAQDVKGNKTVGDRIVDALLEPLGGKPFAYSRGTSAAREVMTNLKLGYRPVASVINRISGLHHTWTKVGTKYLMEGRQWLKTPEGKALLEENKPYLGIEAAFVHERSRPSSQEPLYKPLGFFQAAERSNRPEAFASHFKYAEGELGLKGEAAAEYARKATRFGQFVYDLAALPKAMRGPTGRLVLQFKPYLLKELEFISTLRGAEIPRYLTGFMAVGGPRAALLTLKSLPLLGAWVGFDKLEDWMNRKAPALSRGVGGALGVDVSPSTAFQLPQSAEEILGPTLGDMAKLWKDVVGPALAGEDRDFADVAKWAQRLAPAINYWSQIVEAIASKEGWITDSRGRPQYKPTKSDYAKLALGMKPLEKSIAEVEQRFLRDQEAIERKNRARLVDKFIDAIDSKDGARVQKAAKALAEAGITTDTVKAAARNRNIEPHLRLLRSLSKPTRAKEAERFTPKE